MLAVNLAGKINPVSVKRPSPLERLRHFTSVGGLNADLPWSASGSRSRAWERAYRDRWQHDKIVRSTHGVNCTGSCSWKVHVKDGIITWETQQTDYPSNGSETPDYEPRGCRRGASFSGYTYSPLRVKHPYVRGALLDLWRAARAEHSDPVDAWASIAGNPAYTKQRGKGGFARSSWEEVSQLVAAAHVHTIERHGPDRGAPLIYQLHAVSTLLLFALWPFSRLVHAWSAPVAYLRRSPILYRPQPEEAAA